MVKTRTPHLHWGTQLEAHRVDCERIREVGIGVTGLLGVHVRESSSEETVSFTEFTQWFDAHRVNLPPAEIVSAVAPARSELLQSPRTWR